MHINLETTICDGEWDTRITELVIERSIELVRGDESPLTIGHITAADLAAVRKDIAVLATYGVEIKVNQTFRHITVRGWGRS
jgi:hypothetical protein